MKHLHLSIAAAALISCQSQAAVLDFGSGPVPPAICSETVDGLGATVNCANYLYVEQSYGDVAGVVDFSYSAPRLPGPNSLRWWSEGYNDLYGVLWADGGDGDSRARIEIRAADPLALVTLSGLDLGAYPSGTRNTTLVISTLGGASVLYSYSGAVGNATLNTATHFAPGVSAAGGLWIEWYDSAYNVGIDNIAYTVGSVVPEPGAGYLLLAGVGGLALLVRRRLR